MTRRVYLLSPANCSGKRASYLLNLGATFELARRFHRAGLTLGEAFTFMSGLYFRGKVAYAAAYGTSPGAALVITPDRGLVPVEQVVTPADLRAMAAVPIDPAEARYNRPLVASVTELAAGLKDADEVVLLGSIATGKYVDLLRGPLGTRLRFPAEFVGRGDMSRGGLMLRCVREGRRLTYVHIDAVNRRGTRPPKLPRPR